MTTKPSILVLDDERRLVDEISEFLMAKDYGVISADRPSEAFREIEGRAISLALVDIKLPEYDGLEFVRRLKESRPEIETIMMSGHGDMESVISAFRLGAFDYLKKPFSTMELQAALSRTTRYLEAVDLSRRYAGLCAELNGQLADDGGFVGASAAMETVREHISVAAANPDAPVLIQGESGTGKELVARRIHSLSGRASRRFVPVNCAAVPKDIFESEFFGHEKGAFTDARQARDGLFRSAHGGTLFLDEIGETPVELQPKLLRAIEEKSIRPVGSDSERSIDARIICASNRDLAAQTESGEFRKDLYYRLAVIEIRIPPLRARKEDIPALARRFLENGRLPSYQVEEILSDRLLDSLSGYDFPGNVRELKNIMERAAILGRQPSADDISAWLGIGRSIRPPCDHRHLNQVHSDSDEPLNLEELESRTVAKALARTNGVRTQAARLLGISRQALDRKLEKAKS